MSDKIRDYSNKDCCLNCECFAFWDGDYCCTSNMKIHQYGMRNRGIGNGGFFSDTRMDKDIDRTMKLAKDCEDYKKWGTYMYTKNKPNKFISEYNKFKEWERLCNQLEMHVSNILCYSKIV